MILKYLTSDILHPPPPGSLGRILHHRCPFCIGDLYCHLIVNPKIFSNDPLMLNIETPLFTFQIFLKITLYCFDGKTWYHVSFKKLFQNIGKILYMTISFVLTKTTLITLFLTSFKSIESI